MGKVQSQSRVVIGYSHDTPLQWFKSWDKNLVNPNNMCFITV